VCSLFGRWSAFAGAAGDPPARRRRSREEVSAALVELSAELGRAPRVGDLARRPDMPSRESVALHFGSFGRALRAHGMDGAGRRYTDAELIAALRRARRRLGRPPRPADLKRSRPRAETIARRFGSFAAALQAAGIDPPRRPSRGEVLARLREEARARGGRAPRFSDWREREPPTVWDVVRHFGSWNAGLRAAGIAPPGRPTRDEVIATLRREALRRGGEPPRGSEWKRPMPPTVWDVECHFGSWNAAVEAAGRTPRPQVAKPKRPGPPWDRRGS
jgi:Homing endonuclease associated repeat